ncbi:hypothetical protein [uncultured Roseobacter sp.]|uniref:hypothetical protein n=1 Tax=uncultured Roseobacter sp. TaxID=114847 RepID=UPI00263744BC|nr:hypothetical protein [uncultured Roseobacter sp.]
MIGIVAGWWFGCFIGYRILTQLFFNNPLSLLACITCAVISAGIVFFVTGAYSMAGMKSAARIRLGQSNEGWLGTVLGPFVIASTVNTVCCFGIAFGFTERFYSEMTRTSYRYDFYEQGWFVFALILLVPLTLHFAMILFSLRAQNELAKRGKDDL